MNFGDIYYSDFHELKHDFSIAQVRDGLGGIDGYARVIISDDEEKKYYLHFAYELLDKIQGLKGDIRLKSVLKGAGLEGAPTFEIDIPVESIPEKAVITKGEKAVGYFDSKRMPVPRTRGVRGGLPEIPPLMNPVFFDTKRKMFDVGANMQTEGDGGGTGGEKGMGVGKSSYFLNAAYRTAISINDTLSIRVNLSRTATGNASMPLVLTASDEVDIVVEAKKGFSVLETDLHTIRVLDRDETESVIFKLKPEEQGSGSVRLFAYVKGVELGHMDLSIEVGQRAPATVDPEKKTAPFHVTGASLPDLTLQISKSELGGKQLLWFRITAAEKKGLPKLYLKLYGPVPLELEPAKYFQDFFREIELLPTERDKGVALKKLEKKGIALFEKLLPEEIKKLIWTLKDNITTIKIDSDEPWIPWEICKMTGEQNGRYEEGPFFCEAFNVTRWIPGHGAPKSRIDLSKIAMVIPKDSNLPYARLECEAIEKVTSGISRVEQIRAEYNELTEALESGTYTAWHFSGHGTFSDADNPDGLSKMVLENGQTFTPEAINGKARNMGITAPLVFLNACQIGKGAMELTDIGGWAVQLLDSGAAAFVGAYWSVGDNAAYTFAVALYQALLTEQDMGSAVKAARLAIKADGDPTWLAYTVFTDPFAKCRLVP
jgi:hypothetical protein